MLVLDVYGPFLASLFVSGSSSHTHASCNVLGATMMLAIEHSQSKIIVKSHQLICACNHISLHSVGHPIERHHSTRSGHPIERRHVPHAHPHMKYCSALCISVCRVQQEEKANPQLGPTGLQRNHAGLTRQSDAKARPFIGRSSVRQD